MAISTTQAQSTHSYNTSEKESDILRLSYYKRILLKLKKQLEDKNSVLSDKINEYHTINGKRKNLIKQNFASAAHLEKTHTKYWKTCQQLKQEIEEIRNEIFELKEKIWDNLELYQKIKSEIDYQQKVVN